MQVDLEAVFSEDFFSRPTLEVAPELLGAILCRRLPGGEILSAAIVEVEAYTADDPACHASRGITKRCEVMFGRSGQTYIYFIYGMYNCLNVVTEPDGIAGAVLIRAIDINGGNGPGKLCKTLDINRTHNAINLMDSSGELWLVKGQAPAKNEIACSERIGISLAQERLWRFFIKDHPQVSRKKVIPYKSKTRSTKGKVK